MSTVPEHIHTELRRAAAYLPQITDLCLAEVSDPRERQRTEIGVCMGNMARDLRTALNDAMGDFAECRLKPTLAKGEYEIIEYSHNFPIERNEERFKRLQTAVLGHIGRDFPDIYKFLEQVQPYRNKASCLWHLKTISNISGHTVPIKTIVLSLHAVSHGRIKPCIVGHQVTLTRPDGSWRKVYPSIPCYVPEMGMFASETGKWVLFLIDVGGTPEPYLMRFVERVNPEVEQLILRFYDLWQTDGIS